MAFDVTLRNPGAAFNVSLADAVAFLIGAFWGLKVSVV